MFRWENGGRPGFSVLDGVALVAGAAVASVHLRNLLVNDDFAAAWWVFVLVFLWIALTAAGPFFYVLHRFVSKPPGYPRTGDRLWGLLGLPWLLTALAQTGRPPGAAGPPQATALGLAVGLAIVSAVAMAVVWRTWVIVEPEQATRAFTPPWTNRVGLSLAIAWPVQCGLGLVVTGA